MNNKFIYLTKKQNRMMEKQRAGNKVKMTKNRIEHENE